MNDIREFAQDPFRGLVKPLKGRKFKGLYRKVSAGIASSSSLCMRRIRSMCLPCCFETREPTDDRLSPKLPFLGTYQQRLRARSLTVRVRSDAPVLPINKRFLNSGRIVPCCQFAIWSDPPFLRHGKRPDAACSALCAKGGGRSNVFRPRVEGGGVRCIQTGPLATSGPCRALPKCDNTAVVQTHSGGAK